MTTQALRMRLSTWTRRPSPRALGGRISQRDATRGVRLESRGTISLLHRLSVLLLVAFGVLLRVASPTGSAVAITAAASQTIGDSDSAIWQSTPEWAADWQVLGSEAAQPDVSDTDGADSCVILGRALCQSRLRHLLVILAPDASTEARVSSPSTACTAPRGPPAASV